MTVHPKAIKAYAPVGNLEGGVTVSQGLHVQLECPFQNWHDCTSMNDRGVPEPEEKAIQVENRISRTHMGTCWPH